MPALSQPVAISGYNGLMSIELRSDALRLIQILCGSDCSKPLQRRGRSLHLGR